MCTAKPTLREFGPGPRNEPPQSLSRRERNRMLRILAQVRRTDRRHKALERLGYSKSQILGDPSLLHVHDMPVRASRRNIDTSKANPRVPA